MVDADKAVEFGLVNKSVELTDLLAEATAWAEKLAGKPTIAMNMLKKAVNQGTNVDISSGLDLEAACFGNAFASEDRKEGMQSFIEKRKPQFSGR